MVCSLLSIFMSTSMFLPKTQLYLNYSYRYFNRYQGTAREKVTSFGTDKKGSACCGGSNERFTGRSRCDGGLNLGLVPERRYS